jgi:hypothetical protein
MVVFQIVSNSNASGNGVIDEEFKINEKGVEVSKEYMAELDKATMELAQYIQVNKSDENVSLYSIEYDLENFPKRLINVDVIEGDNTNITHIEEMIADIVQSAVTDNVIKGNEPYEIIVREK